MSGTNGRATDGIALINNVGKLISIFFVVIAILVVISIVLIIVKFAKKSKSMGEINKNIFKSTLDTINQENNNVKPQSWSCTYCGTGNSVEADKCSGCGAKKAKNKDAK